MSNTYISISKCMHNNWNINIISFSKAELILQNKNNLILIFEVPIYIYIFNINYPFNEYYNYSKINTIINFNIITSFQYIEICLFNNIKCIICNPQYENNNKFIDDIDYYF